MKRPIYETLRAIVQGAICGTLAAVPLCLVLVYFGAVGFFVLSLLVSASALAVATVLDRRARHASNGGETK